MEVYHLLLLLTFYLSLQIYHVPPHHPHRLPSGRLPTPNTTQPRIIQTTRNHRPLPPHRRQPLLPDHLILPAFHLPEQMMKFKYPGKSTESFFDFGEINVSLL